MFYKEVTLTNEYDSVEEKTEMSVFVRHFNRPVFQFIVHNQEYIPSSAPLFYNKEENDCRNEMCTEVIIEFKHNEEEYSYTGASICHKSDHLKFNKTEGRKRALARAFKYLKEDGFIMAKDERQKIWNLVLPKQFIKTSVNDE